MKPMKLCLIIFLSILTIGSIYGQERRKKAPKVWVPAETDSVEMVEIPELPEGAFMLELSPEEEGRLLKDLNQNLKKELEVIKNLNVEKYRELLGSMRFKLRDLPVFSRRDKESRERSRRIEELEVQSEALGLQYQNGSQAEKQKYMDNLRQNLSELFELREKERRLEYEELQKRLNELKTTLDQRSRNKEEIIRRRIMELTGEGEYLRW